MGLLPARAEAGVRTSAARSLRHVPQGGIYSPLLIYCKYLWYYFAMDKSREIFEEYKKSLLETIDLAEGIISLVELEAK